MSCQRRGKPFSLFFSAQVAGNAFGSAVTHHAMGGEWSEGAFIGAIAPFLGEKFTSMFGVLDLAFIVKIVMSLVALLFTYDAISGEKEDGTFRLYASFSVSRATIALSKVIGCSVSILIPFALLPGFVTGVCLLILLTWYFMQRREKIMIVVLIAPFVLFGIFINCAEI